MNPRVLYCIGGLQPGGQERQLYYLLQTMDRERYSPAVAVWSFDENHLYTAKVRALNVPVIPFQWRGDHKDKLSGWKRYISETKPEVVHSYSFFTNFITWMGCRGTGAIPIGSVRSGFFRSRKKEGLAIGLLSAHYPHTQIFNSRTAFIEASNSFPLFRSKYRYLVRNGLDLTGFNPTPPPIEGTIHLVGIGSLIQLKRWENLIIVVNRLIKQGFDVKATIAGEGPARPMLKQLIGGLNLQERVTLLGYTDDIPALVKSATILVHPSDMEGCPNAVMEGMAGARPVVGTQAGDIPYLVEDGITGFVVPCGDVDRMTARVKELASDRDLCIKMGIAGRAKAEQEFSLDSLVEGTFNVYRHAGWCG